MVCVGLSSPGTGQAILDLLLGIAAVLIAELHADAGGALPCAPFRVIQMTRPATGSFSLFAHPNSTA